MADKKKKSCKKWTVARHIVQVVFIVLFAAPVLAAGWQLFGGTPSVDPAGTSVINTIFYGTLSSSTILGIEVIDPFAVLEVLLASKTFVLDWILFALPMLALYAVVRGRAFCGWVCPVNLFCEIIDWLRVKLKIKVKEMPIHRHVKLWVALGVLVVSAIVSVPVFELFSPIGAINKLITVGSVTGILTLVAIVLVELFWGHRVWCRSLCPLGGFYEAIGKPGLVAVKIDHEKCIHCNACKKACLCDPVILDAPIEGTTNAVAAGDCMICGKCIDACPVDALHMGIGR